MTAVLVAMMYPILQALCTLIVRSCALEKKDANWTCSPSNTNFHTLHVKGQDKPALIEEIPQRDAQYSSRENTSRSDYTDCSKGAVWYVTKVHSRVPLGQGGGRRKTRA